MNGSKLGSKFWRVTSGEERRGSRVTKEQKNGECWFWFHDIIGYMRGKANGKNQLRVMKWLLECFLLEYEIAASSIAPPKHVVSKMV
jgi:hypothetical protein